MTDLAGCSDEIWAGTVAAVDAARRSKDFKFNQRAQAELLYTVAKHYPIVTAEKQQAMRASLLPIIPRLKSGSRKSASETLEAIIDLARFPAGYEEISRALKVGVVECQEFNPDPAEDIYPTGGWIGDYLRWARNAEVPLGYHFWSAVSLIGAACGYKFFIDRGSYYLRMNFYMVMVGERAAGKSAAKDALEDVLQKANFLIEPDPMTKNPYQVRVLPEDTNQETLITKLAPYPADIVTPKGDKETVLVDSTGYMILDELSTFLGKDNWALAKRIPFLTTMYGRDYYDYETKSGGHIKLINVALSMIACSAPEWMKDSITPLMFGGGFMDRTLFIFRTPVTRSYPTASPLDPVAAVQLAYFIQHLTTRIDRVEMVPTPDANEWYEDWYNSQPKTSDLTGMSTKRRANNIWKLAAILSLSEGAAPWIRTRHIQDACVYLDHEETQFEQFMHEIQRAPEADLFKYILGKLRANGGSLTQSKLFNILRSKRALSPPTAKAVPFIRSLVQMGFVESERKGKTTVYTLTEKGQNDKE